jgi:predicted alpha-1,2-mannosidase
MIGNHAVPVLSRAILTDIPGIDVEEAYRAMVASCTQPHTNSPFDVWEEFGYMPADLQGNSVSITMEQAFDDWCVAAIARYLGRNDDAERFERRSLFYRNLFDAESGFFRPKNTEGRLVEPFNPLAYDTPYFIEGNAWQYMWFVPHDPQGLIDLLGGTKGFIAKLNRCFTLESDERDSGGNASGFIGQYAHGNEPAHHTTYLFNYAGCPWRTQELVDQVRRSFYNARPCGYAGNDDCGQMSAWYVFSALGFYPFNAGADDFAIGTPLYDHAVLHLPNGHDLTIIAPRRDPRAIYVRDIRLNGQRLPTLTITQQQLLDGGTLAFRMVTKHR